MAGSGIRAWNLARVLAPHCEVTLAAPTSGDVPLEGFRVLPVTLDDPTEIDASLAAAEVVISNGNMLHDYPQLERLAVPWVVDAYVPRRPRRWPPTATATPPSAWPATRWTPAR